MEDMSAIARPMFSNALPATAPRMAAPSRTGSFVPGAAISTPLESASTWRTRSLRPAPPLIIILRIGAPARSALPALESRLADEDRDVRQAARDAIDGIKGAKHRLKGGEATE